MIIYFFVAALLTCLSYGDRRIGSQDELKNVGPNVLLITVDDLNDWIGCLGGHPQARTPNIDRLAAQGVLFANAHCAVPICGPSRSCILTGRQPWNTGIYGNDGDALSTIGRKYPTILQTLRKAGYNTYGAGKLLHGNINRYPKDKLFTEYGPIYEKWQPFTRKEVVYTDAEFEASIDKSLLTHEVRRGPGQLNVTFPLNKMPRDRRLGSRVVDSFDWAALDVEEQEMGDFITCSWAIEVLNRDHSKPFLLGVGIYRPHIPLFVPKSYGDLFPPAQIQLPKVAENDLDDLSPVARDFARKAHTAGSHKNVIKHGQWNEAVSCYLACVAFVDAQIGRVVNALEKSPYRNNTAIVLLSDHGWHLGEKEHWGKFAGWEESTRVPFVIVPPRNSRNAFSLGERCHEPVSLIDVYPTLLEMLSLPQEHVLDGISLIPLLQNPQKGGLGYSITTFGRGNHSVRTKDWRFIHYYDGSEELYDLENDPNEFENLVHDGESKDIRDQLRLYLPDYKDVRHFVSMGAWKAVIRRDAAKSELYDFHDNKAVPEGDNVANTHPEVFEAMLRYIHRKQIAGKYVSIPDEK